MVNVPSKAMYVFGISKQNKELIKKNDEIYEERNLIDG
jgi:hypothetical protein